ncbi:FTR1 family iron permease [Calderihabitans maritimus]|uniref:Iron permease FTR1 n=1 Tax=Calderihabitans maritimus TaxID=1246530 RepID=A0A1Z5HRP1_9FIRM|nr:FTR1 family protein [Calderihabitans maritimus]GAW91991.1 hypothetical protein KKC1_11510 [Calderihabitans maritimus]
MHCFGENRLQVSIPFAKAVSLALVLILLLGQTAMAARSWDKVVADIEELLNQSLAVYQQGNVQGAKKLVDEAYFGPFEGEEMEQAIRLNISSRRAYEIEYAFTEVKKMMDQNIKPDEVKQAIEELVAMLEEDASLLQEEASGPVSTFLYSLGIIVREGFEAILIMGAIIAYLVKTGNEDKVKTIYGSALTAIGASVLTALAIKFVFKISGASQEILEGVTMLLAMAVLFMVSYWLISKVEAEKWQAYIEGKVKASLTKGSSLALWFASFLAVYREGAETVLFYQALLSGEEGNHLGMIISGFVLGCLILAIVFYIVRYGSVRLPLKPFFIGTSALMYYLAFVFAGEGVRELQEGGVLGITSVNGLPAIGFLGIYPTWEGLSLQLLLVIAALGGIIYHYFTSRKAAEKTSFRR